MSEQLSELDELIESDVLEALGEKIPEEEASSSIDIDGITIEDIDEEISTPDGDSDDETSLDETNEEYSQEEEIKEIEDTPEEPEQEERQELSSAKELQVNTTDLASLLSQLLNNKTIEITIKVKD